ncbi:hypothetical protein BCR39DRAFT_547829 [Naematelia encephala]|uniref:Rho-GAP domain-containing protein n=1 Tax=Naematelia encephala TaxID=71784 RepID=A0A1Y2AN94_9TREE|nr:hypothetical protein BCR39DRAFT_547829 [Naematelia encephala]
MSTDVEPSPVLGVPLSPPPIIPAAMSDRPSSRPLSEISDNSDRRRSSVRDSPRLGKPSRPNSEIRDGGDVTSATGKRMSAAGPLQTITVNLVEYASAVGGQRTSVVSTGGSGPLSATSSVGSVPPVPPSPSTKPAPAKPEKPAGLASRSVSTNSIREERAAETDLKEADVPKLSEQDSEESKDGVSPLLMAKRASLRPSPLGTTYADIAKPAPSPTLSSASKSSFDSPRSSIDGPARPATRAKPSWLRRASGTAALRGKTKSPVQKDDSALPASSSLPPTLPPRKGLSTSASQLFSTSASQLFSTSDSARMPPPENPRKSSYATVAAAGPSRSRLADGQGRPAYSPSSGPPPLPPRDGVGNIRNRLAAWTAAAQSSTSFSRSESSSSLASTMTSNLPHQRIPSSAQRVLGHAGSAVQKGWAGLRARGVGGSISSMGGLAQTARRGSMEPSGSWTSGLAGRRGSRDRTQSDKTDAGAGDGPIFVDGVFQRRGGDRGGRVFGRDLVEAGRAWGTADSALSLEDESEWQRRRKQSLPAVVVRTVDYLEEWGPKEEGIFRISGRSSHIARLRKEFDSGADLDLRLCHPGDLDPHAVSGIFKTYLRELPTPLLTHVLAPKFEAYVRAQQDARAGVSSLASISEQPEPPETLPALLSQMPNAHWFLLADIVKLLDLIPRYTEVNRMTLNAVMLSLGPSLNIPGPVLAQLLDQKDTLFATPPPPGTAETVDSLVQFGDVDISPPVLPASEAVETSSSSPSPDSKTKAVTPVKKMPRLPSRPSLTRLFTGASVATKHSSIQSVIDGEPPRIDTPLQPVSPLPTFEAVAEPSNDESIEKLIEAPAPVSAAAKIEDVQYPSGTVEERAKLFSTAPDPTPTPTPVTFTPIADKFANTSTQLPPLRLSGGSVRSTSASMISVPSDGSTNPATVIRRGTGNSGGQPVFFSSSSSNNSIALKRNSNPNSTSNSTSNSSGKRKDEDVSTDMDGEAARVKRLSTGVIEAA